MCAQFRSTRASCLALFLTASMIFQTVPIMGSKRWASSDPIPTVADVSETQRVNSQLKPGDNPVAPLAATVTASLADDISLANKKNPGDTITYTATINNGGASPADDATGVIFSSILDANTSLVPFSLNAQPIARADSYGASGNIPISLAAPGVLTNDIDPMSGTNSGLTVTEVQGSAANVGTATNTTATGLGAVKGSVTLSVDGSFTYEPPPGYTGADTFTYKTSEGTLTDTNTVTITISNMVWFIRNTGGGLNRGTFSNPFTTVATFNTANAATDAAPNPKSGDLIALRSGTYAEADGINLRNNQKLTGEAVQFSTVFTAASNSSSAYATFAGATNTAPTISTTAGNGIDLADSNSVRGLNVGNTSGFDFNGAAVGSPVINTVNVTGSGGAINVSTSGTFGANVSFGTLESTSSPGANINLVGVTGTMGITSGGAGLTGSAVSSNAIGISGGSVSFTYPGNVTKSSLGSLLNVSGGHTGTLTFNTSTLSATAGDGLQFNNADGSYDFNGTTSLNGGDAGVDILTGSGGTFSFAAGAAITNPTGTAFNVSASAPTSMTYSGSITSNNSRAVSISNAAAAGCGTQTFGGSINGSGASASGIIVNNCNAGALNFSGSPLTLSTQANNALTLTGNASSTINFSGGNLALTTSTGRGFLASGGGTINVTGSGNAISTTNGTAFEVFGTSGVHMGGAYTFRAITADVDGPANTTVANNGIRLEYHDGPFTITGDGLDADSAPDSLTSGGTITGANERGAEFLNVTGAIFLGGMTFTNAAKSQTVAGSVCGLNLNTNNNTTCNAALHFEATSGGVTLNTMLVDGSVQGGINGYTVTNLNLSNVEVRNVGNEVGENGILIKNLLGSGTATNLNLHDNEAKQLNIINTLNNDLTSFTINTSTFSNSSAPNGGQGILLQTYDSGTSMNVTVSNSTFSNLFSNAHQVSTNTGSTQTISITSSTFTNANAWTVVQASDGGTNNFTLTNNSGTAGVLSGSNAINIKTDNADLAGTPSVASGTISGNTIGSSAVGSGAVCGGGCSGIVVAQRDGGTVSVNITGNTIRHTDAQGIQITGGNSYAGNPGKVVATITGNLIKDPDGGVLAGIHVQAGTQSGDTNCLEATIGGTTNPGVWPSTAANAMNRIEGNWDPTTAPTFSAGNEIFIWRRFTSTLNIPGYTGAAFVTARNSFNSADGTSVGTSGTISSGSCPLQLGLSGLTDVWAGNFPLSIFGNTSVSSSKETTSAAEHFLFPSITTASFSSEVAPSGVAPLSQEQLALVVTAARARWIATGLTTQQTAGLNGIQFEIADLQGAYLGEADGNRILIDGDAGGRGWYTGADASSDLLYGRAFSSSRRYTDPLRGPAGRVDLLTAIEHEMGHRLGLEDTYAAKDRNSLMYGYLTVGERRFATRGQAGCEKPDGLKGSHFLSASDHKPLVPLGGETVTVDGTGTGFTVPGGDSVTITFQATVNTPPMARSVQTQGKVSGSNFALVNGLPTTSPNTNDPETAASGDATATNINTVMTWTGATSSDWNVTTNWSPNTYAPGLSNPAVNDVVIPNVGNQPGISATDIGVYSLNIANGRTLTIAGPRVLTVGGPPGGDLTLDGIISGGFLNLGTGTHVINNSGGTGSLSSTNVATVLSGGTVTLNNNLQAGALAVTAGGSMDITNRTLSINGSGSALTIPGGATFTTTGSTVVFNGAAAQQAAGIAYNNLTINNTLGLHVTGVTLTGNATANGLLALTSSDLDTGAFVLTQPNTTASTGVSDVVGTVRRTGVPLQQAALTYGNPLNTIAYTAAGTRPTQMDVTLAKTAPSGSYLGNGIGFPTAVQRTYTVTPTGGAGYSASMQLRYIAPAELNGNTEATLQFWHYLGPQGWQSQSTSSVNIGNQTVSQSGIASFSPWTMASHTGPTATTGTVSGTIVDNNGHPVEGAAIRMNGTQNRLTVTDANGFYHFENVETEGLYIITPSRANFNFAPMERAFTLHGASTDAAFNGVYDGGAANPLDQTEYFVRQQYLDFLNREPDEPGLNFWVNSIAGCGDDQSCVASKRTETSAAFFLSIEFQQTGYLVYRMYQSAYGDMQNSPVPVRRSEFKPDSQAISNDVIVNETDWQSKLEANKTAFTEAFIQRARFAQAYPASMSPDQFVDTMLLHAGVSDVDVRAAAIAEFSSAGNTADTAARGRALRHVAESSVLSQQEFSQAFVLMQYFGYLGRDPNAAPEQGLDYSGYNFWLNKLESFNGNYEDAQMVEAFLLAGEYRQRFPR
jgi:hypothetical protein